MLYIAHYVLYGQGPKLQEGDPMNVSIGERWEKFVEKTVEEGRYSSASEVVREGLRLVEEREVKIASLRRTLEASIARGGDISEEELDASLDAVEAELKKEGY
jgi:antitoxin ParD1/3/4